MSSILDEDLLRGQTIVFGMPGDLALGNTQPLLFVMVAEQFFNKGFQDQLKEDEQMTSVELVWGEGDRKLEEILCIQF